jgi:plasmid stability protein
MATLTIKNVPDELYQKLKESAEANRRSINSEVIVIIEQAVQPYRRNVKEILAEARALRQKTAHYTISDEELERWISEGRP